MMRHSKLPILGLILALGAAGCSGVDSFYEKEYVLHDGTRAESQEGAAKPAAESSTNQEPATATEAASEAGRPAIAAGIDSATVDNLARIFILENLHDELGRAIRDGVGDLEALQLKQQDVSRELAWRREIAGDAYAEARRVRLEELRNFPITVK